MKKIIIVGGVNFVDCSEGYIPLHAFACRGMYPETNSLPKQHTSQSLLRGMLISQLRNNE